MTKTQLDAVLGILILAIKAVSANDGKAPPIKALRLYTKANWCL